MKLYLTYYSYRITLRTVMAKRKLKQYERRTVASITLKNDTKKLVAEIAKREQRPFASMAEMLIEKGIAQYDTRKTA